MNILYIGKYPPIQGGECNKAYWLLKSLGERGHKISVVTNSLEVEEQYRCKFDEEDKTKLRPEGVSINSTIPVKVPSFIPYTNPYCEKLISLSLEVAEKEKPEIIFGWYLLPYGVAACFTSLATGIPFVIKHAGSDITRLYNDPFIHRTLKEVIRKARGVITSPSLEKFFKNEGASNVLFGSFSIPNAFNPEGENINYRREFNLECNPDRTILFLGKITKSKGLSYLVDSFNRVLAEKTLIVAGDGPNRREIQEDIRERGIKDIHFVGTLPHWKIPRLIRAAKAVVVPEYNFGVSLHRSGIPLEAILCGKSPLVSNQVIERYGRLSEYMVPIDPINPEQFSKEIRRAIDDGEYNAKVKRDHSEIRKEIGNYESYFSHMERLLLEVAHGQRDIEENSLLR